MKPHRLVPSPAVLAWALVFAATVPSPAEAKFCSTDEVPAATLLLPFFEVDLDDPSGFTTLFSINNALAKAGVAHVTLWTDWALPTLAFDVYLTGYDVQTINLRDIFNGVLPRTASDGQDPADQFSPQGFLSEDVALASCATLPYSFGSAFPAILQSELRLAHSGGAAPAIFGGCAGEDHGDGRVRGYVTVDTVSSCSFDNPSTPGYFAGVAARENRLWGTVTYVDAANHFAQQESLVHIEACDPSDPTEECPTGAGSYTFYGRYVGFDGSDDREPLPSTFAASYLNGGAFQGGSQLLVWRDTKRGVTGADGARPCTSLGRPSWYPLLDRDVVSFDEEENPQNHCFEGDHVLPPPGTVWGCFPLATQQSRIGAFTEPPLTIIPSSPFGWIYLDLRHTLATDDPMPGRAQAWVTVLSSASGRFSTAVDAVRLDSACAAGAPPVLIP